MQPEEEHEIAHELQGTILHGPEGEGVAEILAADVVQSGQELRIELSELASGERYVWTVETERVIGQSGTELLGDRIKATIDNLYAERFGSFDSPGTQRYGRAEAVGGVPPGPGDPDLDL